MLFIFLSQVICMSCKPFYPAVKIYLSDSLLCLPPIAMNIIHLSAKQAEEIHWHPTFSRPISQGRKAQAPGLSTTWSMLEGVTTSIITDSTISTRV